ncbi:MAG: DNA translocase FtsK 4TM domain-containing protein [Bdellovibrionota bacterium]
MLSDKKNKKVSAKSNGSDAWHPLKDFLGFVCLSFAVFLFICLISYDPKDPSLNTKILSNDYSIGNYGGIVGSYLADFMMQVFGYASYLFPIAMIEIVRSLVFKKTWQANLFKIAGFVLLLVFTSLGLSLANTGESLPLWGGFAGYYAKLTSIKYMGMTGTILLWSCFGLTSISMVFGWGVKDFMIAFSHFSAWLAQFGKNAAIKGKDKIAEAYEHAQEAIRKEEKNLESGMKEIKKDIDNANVIPIKQVAKPKISIDEKKPIEKKLELVKEEPKPTRIDNIDGPPIVLQPTKPASTVPALPDREQGVAENTKEKKTSNYKLPTAELLSAPENQELEINRDELLENANILEQKLRDFGVDGKVVEVQPGPVVTMYEFEPASGVKVNQITRLNDDLTMALAALSVRISLIPGKSVIGIEVANRNRQIVYLKDIISNDVFEENSSKLAFAIGKDISGNAFTGDLRKMPHLLVAGATGSGKSVAINSMILSVLYKSTPDEVRMILVDPKMLELSMYDGIPHLLLPVVTDPRKAAAALRWATQEMERRYRLMANLGVRNLEGYNAKVLQHMKDNPAPAQESLPIDGDTKIEKHEGKIPYLMIVIDELADLMMVSSREVEDSIIRLAQMARASGIHLVLGTQRPSVDVLTGVIKANMPSRISFKVASKIDSRTILDTNGAEVLLGAGDMLFMPPGSARITRLHGAFVSDQEVEKVTNFWKAQGDPEYREEILAVRESDDDGISLGGDFDEEDDLYRKALEVVVERKIASISYIQRRLRIGYNRAARLVERMDEEGLLAPGEHGKPREILTGKMPL